MKPKRHHLLLPLAVVVAYWLLPPLIHRGYRLTTSPAEEQAQRALYHQLANAELSLTDPHEIETSQRRRIQIYHWIHARGWNIDEGDEERLFGEEWIKLFRHWRGH